MIKNFQILLNKTIEDCFYIYNILSITNLLQIQVGFASEAVLLENMMSQSKHSKLLKIIKLLKK